MYAENDYDDMDWLTQHCPTSPPIVNTSLRLQSIFNPVHNKGPHLQTFCQVVYANLRPMSQNKSNLTPLEHQALDNLMNKKSIIKLADKGVGIVVQDTDDYIHES